MDQFYRFEKSNSRKRKIFRSEKLVRAGFIAIATFGILALGAFAYFAKDLPDPDKIDQRQVTESTKIYDRTGKVLLYDIHGEEKRTIIKLEDVSTYLKRATIAAEDAEFYNHIGINLKGILRAIFYDIVDQTKSQGGSTITQQFIKKAVLSDEKTFTRKIKEAVLAIELEMRYSKDEILNMYLNQIPYGSNAYGIEAASQTFFGKSAKDLTLAESTLLASLPQAPSRLSPYGSHPEDLKARQEYVLNQMVKYNYITKEQAEAAKKETLTYAPGRTQNIKAPHFVMYVKEYLEDKYGKDYIEKSGLKVYTTLDWDLQDAAEKIVAEGAKSNWTKYQAYNAAMTAIDPKTGQILMMVGSRDYFDVEHDGNVNVTIRDRQPGSSFKPFAYVTAFEKGYTPDTVLFDLKTEFNPTCPASGDVEKDENGLDCYHPGNYDSKFRGPTTARQALSQSLNIPAVQMLYLAGIEDTIKTAKNMGITSLNGNYYGLSLVLGGGEVKLLDEVSAYGVFAAEGEKNEKTPILKIEDKKGEILEEYKKDSENIMKSQYARLISDILSDNAARTPVFGPSSALYFPDRPVAAKTGTTQGYRDAWTVGYTPSLVAGIWVGNNNNKPMAQAGAGISAAGPLWHEFIKKAYELKTKDNCGENNGFCLPKQAEQFNKPEPIQTDKPILNGSYINTRYYNVDKITGGIASDNTPPELITQIPYKEVHSILYYVDKNDPQGDYPQNPSSDPQFKNWEAAVAGWALANGFNYQPTDNQPLPQSGDTRSKNNLPTVRIINPAGNSVLSSGVFTAQAEASAPLGVKQVDFFLNDEYVGSTINSPYQLNIKPPKGLSSATLKARVYDEAYNRQEDQITIHFR